MFLCFAFMEGCGPLLYNLFFILQYPFYHFLLDRQFTGRMAFYSLFDTAKTCVSFYNYL